MKKFLDFLNLIKEDVDVSKEDVSKEDVSKSRDGLIELPFDDFDDDYDSITISNKMENRLKELKIKREPNIKVGDTLFMIDDNKRRLPDDVYSFLKNRKLFTVERINDKGKLDLGFYKRYIRESDSKKIKKVFYFNSRRFQKIDNLDKVSKFILSLKHIKKDDLVEFPMDYIDVDDKGVISALSRRNLDSGDPFKSKRRRPVRITRLLNGIVKKEYYDENISQKDIESFMNKWRIMFDDSYQIRILEGEDILDAYDYDMISNWKSSSCANFDKSKNPNFDKYKVYTENKDNIKCLVVYHKGKIYGRRMLFVGIQTETYGSFKKGDEVKLLNHMYGEGGRGSKVDQLMKRWAKDNGAIPIDTILSSGSVFRIKINKTCYKRYPPWDTMVVNFDTDEIASKVPGKEKGWRSAYGAVCNKKK